MFGLPDDVYVVLTSGPDLEPLLDANERVAVRARRGAAAARRAAAVGAAAVRSTRSASAQARIQSALGARRPRWRLRSPRRRRTRASAPVSFEPFVERLPTLLDGGQRLTYDGYVAHGLGDLLGRFVARDGDGWLLATYAFPSSAAEAAAALEHVGCGADPSAIADRPAARQPRAGRRFLPQFVKGLLDRHDRRRRARRDRVPRLAAVAAGARADGDRADLGRGPARARARRARSVRAVRGRDVRRHRRRLRHPPRAPLSGARRRRSRRSRSSRRSSWSPARSRCSATARS